MNGLSTPVVASAVWCSAALNVGIVLMDLAIGSYQAAGFQSVVVAGAGVWLWVIPKVDSWLEARIGEATAQRRLAELALDEMEHMKRTGDLRVYMNIAVPNRVN